MGRTCISPIVYKVADDLWMFEKLSNTGKKTLNSDSYKNRNTLVKWLYSETDTLDQPKGLLLHLSAVYQFGTKES